MYCMYECADPHDFRLASRALQLQCEIGHVCLPQCSETQHVCPPSPVHCRRSSSPFDANARSPSLPQATQGRALTCVCACVLWCWLGIRHETCAGRLKRCTWQWSVSEGGLLVHLLALCRDAAQIVRSCCHLVDLHACTHIASILEWYVAL